MGTRVAYLIATVAAVAVMAIGRPVAAQPSWDTRMQAIDDKYYLQDKQPEAVVDMRDGIADYGNDYSNELHTRMLGILKEYFGKVKNDPAQFSAIVYSMFAGVSSARIDRTVKYFEGAGELYQLASDARRKWYTPDRAELSFDKYQIDIGATTAYQINALNSEGFAASGDELDIGIEDPTIARLEGEVIRGMRPGRTIVTITNNQGFEMDKKEIEVLPAVVLDVDPPNFRMTQGESHQFVIKANKTLEADDLSFSFSSPDAAELKVFSLLPNATEQHVEVKALVPSLTDYRLNVAGPEGSKTFSTVSIIPIEPVKPGKKWQIGASVVTVGGLALAVMTQLASDSKYDEYLECSGPDNTNADDPACVALLNESNDKQSTARLLWGVTGVCAVVTGYLWYRYYGNMKRYNGAVDEYEQYTRFNVEVLPTAVAVSMSF